MPRINVPEVKDEARKKVSELSNLLDQLALYYATNWGYDLNAMNEIKRYMLHGIYSFIDGQFDFMFGSCQAVEGQIVRLLTTPRKPRQM